MTASIEQAVMREVIPNPYAIGSRSHRVVELANNGVDWNAIAERVGVTRSAVRLTIKRAKDKNT